MVKPLLKFLIGLQFLKPFENFPLHSVTTYSMTKRVSSIAQNNVTKILHKKVRKTNKRVNCCVTNPMIWTLRTAMTQIKIGICQAFPIQMKSKATPKSLDQSPSGSSKIRNFSVGNLLTNKTLDYSLFS